MIARTLAIESRKIMNLRKELEYLLRENKKELLVAEIFTDDWISERIKLITQENKENFLKKLENIGDCRGCFWNKDQSWITIETDTERGYYLELHEFPEIPEDLL